MGVIDWKPASKAEVEGRKAENPAPKNPPKKAAPKKTEG